MGRSKGSSKSSSSKWDPDVGDGSIGESEDLGKCRAPSPSATNANTKASQQSQSPNRKRSDSSTQGWNPDQDSDEGTNTNNSDRAAGADCQLPFSIDVTFPFDNALQNGPAFGVEEGGYAAAASTISHRTACRQPPTKPPERIRYEMLGAPSLLYRHAPSYIEPYSRPSTLTPHQLSMALYMNKRPMKDWLTDKKSRKARRTHSARSALLSCSHVPRPPRPWGQSHDWDCRHAWEGSSSHKKTVKDHQWPPELDVLNIAEDLHSANREKARVLWRNIEQRNRAELHQTDTPQHRNSKSTGFNQPKQSTRGSAAFSGPQQNNHLALKTCSDDRMRDMLDELPTQQKHSEAKCNDHDEKSSLTSTQASSRKGATTAFNVFRSKYIESNPLAANATKEDRKSYTAAISADWKALSKEEKSMYKTKAKRKTEKRSNLAQKEPDQKKHRKGRVTGFHLFLSDYVKSNPLAENASGAVRKAHLMETSTIAKSKWKQLTEHEKSEYSQRARAANQSDEIFRSSGKKMATREFNKEDEDFCNGKGKGKTTGFHIFLSESTLRHTQSNPGASAAERKAAMINCQKDASADWKKMSQTQRSRFQRRANIKNENRAEFLPAKLNKFQSAGRRGRTTGYNIFYSEAMSHLRRPNAVTDDSSSKKAYFDAMKAKIINQWKRLTEAEKSRYRENAERRNTSPLVENSKEEANGLDGNSNLTSHDTILHNSKQHENCQEDRKFNPYCSRDVVTDDIQLLHDEYLSSSRNRVESCADYFSPFRRHDVGLDFDSADELLETEGLVRLPANQGKDAEGVARCEKLKEHGNATKDPPGIGQHDSYHDPLTNDMDVSISEDLSENRQGVGGPLGYGNCLITIPCRCHSCESQPPSWFLIHPAGENLSFVAMSKICLPRDPLFGDCEQGQKVDVGGRVMQISQCGVTVSRLTANQTIFLVARTTQYCSVVTVKASTSSLQKQQRCSIELHMQEFTRIDMRARRPNSLHTSYLPVHFSCDPKSFFPFSCPSFAILSSDYHDNCTTIHKIALREEAEVSLHSFSSSLADISLIEFDPSDRLVVWAAARYKKMPELSPGFFKARSGAVTGFGHSLFRIDLRNDSASLVWSPSHEEYMNEGLHSINGIMPDARMQHLLWVSSSSACKVWALDIRYRSPKTLVSWSLPLLCDDFGPHMTVNGIYGGGVLMNQPPPLMPASSSINDEVSIGQNIQTPTMFCVRKDPNSFAVGVHQFPSAMPRFQTKPLESAGFQEVPKVKYDTSSIARSAIFPLPDVSSNIFNVGLATFRCSCNKSLDAVQLGQLGYQIPPANMTVIISMTSMGDMYCHSTLEANAMEATRARQFPGIPVGTRAIPVPSPAEKVAPTQGQLILSLVNEFPIPSSAITPYVIRDPSECCSFKSFSIKKLTKALPSLELGDSETEAINPSVCLASACKAPRSLYTLTRSKETLKQNDNTETFWVASNLSQVAREGFSINPKNPKAHADVQHSLPKFGLLSESSNEEILSDQICLPSSHMLIASESGGADSSSSGENSTPFAYEEKQNVEIGLELIKKLKRNYFNKTGRDDVGVKSEWSTDSD